MDSTNHSSPTESSSEVGTAVCTPCSEVAALVVSLNDPQVCEALRCLLSRAERVERENPRDKLYLLDLVGVPQVAQVFRKSEAWVRRHKRELGVITIGCGRGADLLFARGAIETYLRKHATRELRELV